MFVDPRLNGRLIRLIERNQVPHAVDPSGLIHFRSADEERIESDFVCRIRDAAFASWQVLTCPPAWLGIYREYMRVHEIRFVEELTGSERWFLLERRYRPHQWKLEAPRSES